jgi:pilus assembly protein CpaF
MGGGARPAPPVFGNQPGAGGQQGGQSSGYGAHQLANFPGFANEAQQQTGGLFGGGGQAQGGHGAPTGGANPGYGHDGDDDDDDEGGETGAEIKARAQQSLLESLGNRLYDPSLSEDDLSEMVVQHLAEFFGEGSVTLTPAERQRLTREVTDDLLRHGPIEPFLSDPAVSEVMVNGCKAIYVEKSGKLVLSKVRFANEQQLRRVIERIVGRVGRRIDESSPMVDARLPDGSRVNAIIPPLAVDGSTLTIRKFTADSFTVDDLVAFRSMSRQAAILLEACVRGRLNVVVSGGTGSGKTTLLNVLSSFIPADERIITIEDAVELKLRQHHTVRLETRPPNIEGKGAITIRDLVRNSLRMRPDRVVIGECRAGEALDMLQAMNTGHDGSLTTLHANSPRDTLSRLETLVLMAGMDLPVRAIREQIAGAVDLIVQIQRLKDGSRRVTHITEVVGMEGDIITLSDIYTMPEMGQLDDHGKFTGTLLPTGLRPLFAEKLADYGIELPADIFGRPEALGFLDARGGRGGGGW